MRKGSPINSFGRSTIKHAQPNRGGSKRPPTLVIKNKSIQQCGKLSTKTKFSTKIYIKQNNVIKLNKKLYLKIIYSEMIKSKKLANIHIEESEEVKLKK
ncbi:MAG: hypothetical protein BGO29_14970 [Bacteroidales bacterium 36-12]|nr:MAG: hypothetical protein BGO29_14970 [Bacteroidales bacterium 36-12]